MAQRTGGSMKYIFKQYVIEYTAVDAENEEAAF
jgi:hypothetical protein